MSAGAPWSVKGIDPKAREIAKDLARRSGMTLGEWLNQMILEDGAPEAASESPRAGSDRRGRNLDNKPGDTDGGIERVSRALEGLTARIETAEQRSSQAIGGVDRAVAGLLMRLEGAERSQGAAAFKFDRAAETLRAEQARIGDRIRRVENEAAGPRSLEALKALEAAMGKLAGQLYEGDMRTREAIAAIDRRVERLETAPGEAALIDGLVARIGERLEQAEARTSEAIRALEGSLTHLDARLGRTEETLADDSGSRFEVLAENLSLRMDAARDELARGLGAAVDGRFGRIEKTIEQLSAHVDAAETRSAQAIEHMGHEVVRIARNLDTRMTGVERIARQGLAETRGELARIASAADQRFRSAETAQSQALERLGQEISRISEQMAERIISVERRSAMAAEDAGERVERAACELSDRIRESEERTARLIGDTRERIELQPAPEPAAIVEPELMAEPITTEAAHEIAPEVVAAPAPAWVLAETPAAHTHEPEPVVELEATALDAEHLFEPHAGIEAEAAAMAASAAIWIDDGPPLDTRVAAQEPAPELTPELESLFEEPAPPFEAHSDAGPAQWPEADAAEDHDLFAADTEFLSEQAAEREPVAAEMLPPHADDAETEAAPQLSTRAALESARIAARKGLAPDKTEDRGFSFGLGGLKLGPRNKLRERVGKEGRRDTSMVKTAALSSAFAVILTSSVVGYKLTLARQSNWAPSSKLAMGTLKIAEPDTTPKAAEALDRSSVPTLESGRPAPSDEPTAAVPPSRPPAATSPMAEIALATPPSHVGDPAASDLYQEAVKKLAGQEKGGVALLTRAANLGYAPAEFHLGKLYENGEAGLAKDPAAARRWTERAADGGEARAMHNLALFYFDGVGGPKDLMEAASWFHKAAVAGLVDSQYNLGRLYEQGYGVQRDPIAAYKWYLVAAKAGDKESKSAAETLRNGLAAQDAKEAERWAATFHPGVDDDSRVAAR